MSFRIASDALNIWSPATFFTLRGISTTGFQYCLPHSAMANIFAQSPVLILRCNVARSAFIASGNRGFFSDRSITVQSSSAQKSFSRALYTSHEVAQSVFTKKNKCKDRDSKYVSMGSSFLLILLLMIFGESIIRKAHAESLPDSPLYRNIISLIEKKKRTPDEGKRLLELVRELIHQDTLLRYRLLNRFKALQKKIKPDRDESVEIENYIIDLLRRPGASRTIEESITLFNCLKKKEEELILKAKGKDIVILFGATGSGKSLLAEFLHGGTITEGKFIDDTGKERDVLSLKEGETEKAPICHSTNESGTIIANVLDSSSVECKEEDLDQIRIVLKQFTLFDMPGDFETRGFEVGLAQAMHMKSIVDVAKTVRFVMVCDYFSIEPDKGAGWKRALEYLQNRFADEQKILKISNLHIVITKQPKDQTVDDVISLIKTVTPKGWTDYSDKVIIYNPQNSKDRVRLLEMLLETPEDKGSEIASKITLDAQHLRDAIAFCQNVKEAVMTHLKKGEIEQAIELLQFTYRMAETGDISLKQAHKLAQGGVVEYCKEKFLFRFKTKNYDEAWTPYAEYLFLKERFPAFLVDFAPVDTEIKLAKKEIEDPLNAQWNTVMQKNIFHINEMIWEVLNSIRRKVPPLRTQREKNIYKFRENP